LKVHEAVLTNIAVRDFKDEPVSDEDLLKILDAGRLCQSGKNLQPWYFIVIRRRELLNALADLMKGDIDEERTREAPLAIGIVSDPRSEFHVVDAARAAQNMTLVAWELGVGSAFISGPEPPERDPYRMKAKKLLGIPENLNFIDLIIFGYPKRWRTVKRKNRKALHDIVFDEKFGSKLNIGNVDTRP
jgi:nitroreductase